MRFARSAIFFLRGSLWSSVFSVLNFSLLPATLIVRPVPPHSIAGFSAVSPYSADRSRWRPSFMKAVATMLMTEQANR